MSRLGSTPPTCETLGKITANADKLKITKQAAKISPAFVSTRPLKMNEVLFGRFPKYTVLKLWVRVKLLKRYDKFWNFLWNIKAIKSNLTCQQCVNIVLLCVCQIFGEICPEKYGSGDSIICWWDPARFWNTFWLNCLFDYSELRTRNLMNNWPSFFCRRAQSKNSIVEGSRNKYIFRILIYEKNFTFRCSPTTIDLQLSV